MFRSASFWRRNPRNPRNPRNLRNHRCRLHFPMIFPTATRPLAFARQRLLEWWLHRLPLTDSLLLTQRNVYILPTWPGLMLALTLLVLLLASINYQLNLGYLLTFMLSCSAFAGVHIGHGTLRALRLNLIAPAPQFAGSSAVFSISLCNERRSSRHAIALAVRPDATAVTVWSWTDVPAQGSSTLQLAFMPARRGVQRLPTLLVETRFPIGTFRIWALWRPAATILVYPQPESHPPPLPPGQPRSAELAGALVVPARVPGMTEFDSLRTYRRGDPLKLVLWKKSALADENGNGLLVRQALPAPQEEQWLILEQTGRIDREAQLSRLCAWLLQADQLGLRYGLRLPALQIAPSSGEAHKQQCLEALALC
jgi:uncharacterized protein (DUF58 family)